MRRLAAEDRFDYLLIESTGISEPMPVAATFAVRDEQGFSLSDVARLDTMVTVADAATLVADFSSPDMLQDRGQTAGDEDQRALVDLLTEQLEFANVIVFDFEAAQRMAGWARELAGEHTPETEAYGISSFVYRARRPFHPQRLMALFNSDWPGVVRSKGFFWLATRNDWVGEMQQAGGALTHKAAGFWWASAPASEQPDPARAPELLGVEWDPHWGDRRQELVFIGIDMDEAAMRRALDAALLTDAEFAQGPGRWSTLPDPFPRWSLEAEDAA